MPRRSTARSIVRKKVQSPTTGHRWIAAMLLGSSVIHFLRPKTFDAMVPHRMPGRARTWVTISGVAEVAAGALILNRPTRSAGGLLSAALFAAVFPAHITSVIDGLRDPHLPVWRKIALVVRLPLQWPLVRAALAVAARA